MTAMTSETHDSLDGIIVIDKPAGITSAAVVARVKRRLRVKRVGHTGTLDPMATGVLPLCLGQGTKVAGYLLAEDKTYEAEIELGYETDTLDADGQITSRHPEAAMQVTEARVREVLHSFIGPGMQVPPMYSAIKHQGKRLYKLARAGQTVERKPRPIDILTLDLLTFDAAPTRVTGDPTAMGALESPVPARDAERPVTPRVRFSVHCSKGTYVRTLAADIGKTLGCGAHLTALRRVQSGAFTLTGAIELAEINRQIALQSMISANRAVAHLPAVQIPDELIAKVASGLVMPWQRLAREADRPPLDQVIRLVASGDTLAALASVDGDGRVRYRRVFQGIRLPT